MQNNSLLAIALVLSLAACDEPTNNLSAANALVENNVVAAATNAQTGNNAAAANGPAIALEGEGLRALDPQNGHATQLPFGLEEATTITALTAAFGRPDTITTNSECGEGPLKSASWSKGLTVYFQDGKFVGWGGAVDLKTADGIGFGSTRAELDAAYSPKVEETSLGTEFTTDGGMSGILESAAKDAAISEIWAGMTCIAR
jgi:hypothetical protein